MVTTRTTHKKLLQPLLHEVSCLLDATDWRVSVTHVYLEANRRANLLANEGHSDSFVWTVFDKASPSLALLLLEDGIGCSIPRFVT